MSETEIAARIASTLAGKFYPGQRVRIGGTWQQAGVGEEAVIVRLSYAGPFGDVWELNRVIDSCASGKWNAYFLEPMTDD